MTQYNASFYVNLAKVILDNGGDQIRVDYLTGMSLMREKGFKIDSESSFKAHFYKAIRVFKDLENNNKKLISLSAPKSTTEKQHEVEMPISKEDVLNERTVLLKSLGAKLYFTPSDIVLLVQAGRKLNSLVLFMTTVQTKTEQKQHLKRQKVEHELHAMDCKSVVNSAVSEVNQSKSDLVKEIQKLSQSVQQLTQAITALLGLIANGMGANTAVVRPPVATMEFDKIDDLI